MQVTSSSTDQELMNAYLADDVKAFEIIYQRYSSKVYGFLHQRLSEKEHVDEVFQNIFFKFHKSRDQYNPKFPLLAWLYTISRSCLIDFVRQRKRYSEILEELTKQQTDPEQNARGDCAEPQELIDSAQGKPKQALQLRYIDDCDFDEIARQLNTAPSSARKLVSRAIRQIKNKLKTGSDHE